jgi:hypothetical protein
MQSGHPRGATLRSGDWRDIIIVMKARASALALGLMLSAWGAASQAQAGKTPGAGAYAEIVFAQGGDIIVLSDGKQKALKDPIGERLSPGDQVQTGSKTSVELVLMPRMSRLRLSENTVATIREIATNGATGIELLYGRLRSKVVRMTDRDAQFDVRSANVVAAVRGTDFGCDVVLDPSGGAAPTKVYCFEGSVDVSPTRAPPGAAPVAVEAGSMAIVSAASGGAEPRIATSSIDGDTLKYWKANEFTQAMPAAAVAPPPVAVAVPPPAAPSKAETVLAAPAPPAATLSPSFDLEPIRRGIKAKNAAIIGSGILFTAGAALGGAGYYFRDSNPDLSDTLLLSGALTATLAIPSLVLAISINPLAKAKDQ